MEPDVHYLSPGLYITQTHRARHCVASKQKAIKMQILQFIEYHQNQENKK